MLWFRGLSGAGRRRRSGGRSIGRRGAVMGPPGGYAEAGGAGGVDRDRCAADSARELNRMGRPGLDQGGRLIQRGRGPSRPDQVYRSTEGWTKSVDQLYVGPARGPNSATPG